MLGPFALDATHAVAGFDCGVIALNDYIVGQALIDQRSGKSRTFVATRGGRVAAFFSLAPAGIGPQNATERAAKGQGSQDIPAILLARFAVHFSEQGRGIGRAMLVDALARCAQAADAVGFRAVLANATDDRARSFYLKHDFEPSPTNPLHLMMLMKDVRKTLNG